MTYPQLLSKALSAVVTGLLTTLGSAEHDASLLLAHRRVLQAVEVSPRKLQGQISNASDEEDSACSICYGGVKPHEPNRELFTVDDEGIVGGNATFFQPPMTCSSYSTQFLSALFPEDPSCRAFQGSAADICGCPRPPSVCTICDFGLPPSTPENMLPIGSVGNSAPLSCSDWQTTSSALYFEGDRECDDSRNAAMKYCGCPEPCHLCGEGYRLANPTAQVDDSQGLVSTIVGLFDEEDEYPTCRDAENAAAIASAFFSTPYGEDVFETDTGALSIFAGVSNVCELYKGVFMSTCGCLEVENYRAGCHACENGISNPAKEVYVDLDGISATTTCANVNNLALLGLGGDICSQISSLDCPCKDDDEIPSVASAVSASKETTSGASMLDAVGVSMAFSAIIVAFAALY